MGGIGDIVQLEKKRSIESIRVCGNLEEVNLKIGGIEEDVVDGFLFQSYSKATDLPLVQPMSNLEVFSLNVQEVL